MSVVVYVGRYRSRCGIDSGFSLVQDLRRAGLDICAVLVNAGDKLAGELEGHAHVMHLPAFLSLPRAQIRMRLSESGPQSELESTVTRLAALKPLAGLLYYGSWLPPQISAVPQLGFLNFHPAPLPYLRGFECNTFAILRGCPRFRATVHEVREDYDVGAVYALSPEEELDPWCVPPELLARVDRHAPEVLAEGLRNRIAGRQVQGTSCPPGSDEFVADRARLLEQCRIDWEADSVVGVWRKFRAFCGQQTGLRLRTQCGGATRFVDDILVLDNAPHSPAGEVLGRYEEPGEWRGYPVVGTRDGTVVLKLGGPAPLPPTFREGRNPLLMNRGLLHQRCLAVMGL